MGPATPGGAVNSRQVIATGALDAPVWWPPAMSARRGMSRTARPLRPTHERPRRDGRDDDHTRRPDVKYMLMIYDNPDTREIFFGEAGRPLMAEMDALMAELRA